MVDTTSAHPTKEYIRQMPATWWLKKRPYFLFIVRELTSVFVGAYAVFLILLAGQLDNPDKFSGLLHCPLLIALQIIGLPMLLYHSITWFNLTPKAVVVWRGEERVSPLLIAGSNYVVWLIVSIVILWIVL